MLHVYGCPATTVPGETPFGSQALPSSPTTTALIVAIPDTSAGAFHVTVSALSLIAATESNSGAKAEKWTDEMSLTILHWLI